MIDLTELFCSIDDFCKNFEALYKQSLLEQGKSEPKRRPSLYLSEIMAIVVLFHIVGYRNFKTFYNLHIVKYFKKEFPNSPSYNRFVELKKLIVFPLHCYLMTRLGNTNGISFIDSTPLSVCHPRRIHSHKVFKDIAKRGKTSTGWFYGFKLHVVVNDGGELLAFMLTSGNVDDRVPVPELTKKLFGKIFGDKGYISSELGESLLKRGLQLITKIKSNMKNKMMLMTDKLLLRKRGIIETIIDQFKNISQIEHTRHRSPINFIVNVFAGLIAYTYQPKKPGLHLNEDELKLLAVN
jgi:hypothetical protein